MEDSGDKVLRHQLASAIRGGEAHLDASGVFKNLRNEDWGRTAANAPHTLWQLLEHTRFTLGDLLAFSTDPKYTAPKWPDDYWPREQGPRDAGAAQQSLHELEKTSKALTALVENPETDLFAKIAWGDGQTILRQALLAAAHTSYHLGQAMFLRKQLEATPS